MTEEIKEKLNKTINELCEALGFTTPLNIIKVAAATTDLFYDLQNENDELSNSVTELTNSVTELTNSKTELEKKVTELKQQIEKMKNHCDCEFCINVISGDEFTVENTNKTVCEYCMENNKKLWELAE